MKESEMASPHKTVQVNKYLVVELPRPVNFLRNANGKHAIEIATLTDKELRRVGRAMVDALVLNARNRDDRI